MIDILSKHTNVGQVQKAAQDSQSLEEFLEACFSGSGQDICVTPLSITALVPRLCRLIVGKEITDHSHYDGYIYDPGKPPLKNASLVLKGNAVFLNDNNLQCALDDPSLQSLRIQLHNRQYRDGDKVRAAVPEASLYFDFWDEKQGFAKKCVILSIRLGRKKLTKMESELGRQKEQEARKRIEELKAKEISSSGNPPQVPDNSVSFRSKPSKAFD